MNETLLDLLNTTSLPKRERKRLPQAKSIPRLESRPKRDKTSAPLAAPDTPETRPLTPLQRELDAAARKHNARNEVLMWYGNPYEGEYTGFSIWGTPKEEEQP